MRFKVGDLVTFDVWASTDESKPNKARIVSIDHPEHARIVFLEGQFKGDHFDVQSKDLKLLVPKSNPGFGSFWDDIAE